jgi:hypothetical protein
MAAEWRPRLERPGRATFVASMKERYLCSFKDE